MSIIDDVVNDPEVYVGDPDVGEGVYRATHTVPESELENVRRWQEHADTSLDASRVWPIPQDRARRFLDRHSCYEWPGFTEFALGHFFDAENPNLTDSFTRLGGVVTFGHSGRSAAAWTRTLADRNTIELQRGVSAWWTPENSPSNMVSWACKWLADNSEYDTVTATADPDVGAVGTIYQACNFTYLGQGVGDGDDLRYFEINGERVHPRRLYDRHGTSSWDVLKDHYGDRIERVRVPAKHRYAFALDGADLGVEALEYPKRDEGDGADRNGLPPGAG